MGLFDKIKNFFYDEEEVVANKSIPNKEESKRTPVATLEDLKPTDAGEKKAKAVNNENVDNVISERELFKSEPTFKFPIIFEEEDFVEEKKKNHRMNVLDVENNKSRGEMKTSSNEEKKSFRPTPIISPIYGVLDKNYKKEDVTVKEENLLNLYDTNKRVDIDEVIEKAYGRFKETDEKPIIEESVVISIKEEEPIDLFKNMKDEESKELSRTRHARHANIDLDAEEEEVKPSVDERLKSIDELLENTNEQDFYTLVDSMYKNDDEGDSE